MQRGVDLSNLDVSYVSSLALYFLLMFGLNDVYNLLLGEGSEMDEQKMMQMQVRTSSTYKQYGNVARTSTFQFYRKASTAFYPFLFASVNSASFYRYPQFINFGPLLHQ